MRRILPLLIAAGAALATACMSVSEPTDLTLNGTDTTVVGVFNLVAVNGQTLPLFSFNTPTAEWDVIGEKFLINADKSWTDSSHYEYQNFGSSVVVDTVLVAAGTYAISGGKINFTTATAGGTPFPGSVTGNSLTVIFSNQRWVYGR